MFQHDIRRIALARELLSQTRPHGHAPATGPAADPPEAVLPGGTPDATGD